MDIFGGHYSAYHRSQSCEGLGVEVSTPSRGNCMCKGPETGMNWACSQKSKATLLESNAAVTLILINFIHGASLTSVDECSVLINPDNTYRASSLRSSPPFLISPPFTCLALDI